MAEDRDRLTPDELARRAGIDRERVDRLVELGILQAAADGSLSPADVFRARLVSAFEAAGTPLEALAAGIARGVIWYDETEIMFPDAAGLADETYGQFIERMGPNGPFVPRLLSALGLPEPPLDRPLREDDAMLVPAFLDTWALEPTGEVLLRAARVYGEAVSRIARTSLDLYVDAAMRPLRSSNPTRAEARQAAQTAAAKARQIEDLVERLMRRYLEDAYTAAAVEGTEELLAGAGLAAPGPDSPPAIAFVDLTGYTHHTETHGDAEAAQVAGRLAELATAAVRPVGGHLVKVLGDGVLLRLPSASAAIEAVETLVGTTRAAGLPPVHAGIHCGRVVDRDGDVFGRTVNIAARIGGQAGAGEILVSADVLAEADRAGSPVRAEPLGPVALKGIGQPVMLHRLMGERRS